MRERGQGTIVELPNARFRVAVCMADGRRVWRRAATLKQAEKLRRQLVDARELELDPSRMTVEAWCRSWIDGLAGARNARIRPRTVDTYRSILEVHVLPELGRIRLPALTRRRIQAWVDADASSPRSVEHHYRVLHKALAEAVKDRLLPWNPAAGVELPPVDTDVADPLELEEARALLEATADDRLHALWRLALVTGLRQAELLGLTWDDLRGDRLVVRLQLQRLAPERGGDRNGWTRVPTKAARRVPEVTLDPDTVAVLEAHRRRQAEERTPAWQYFGMMFVTGNGNPYHGTEVLKAFKLACKKAGIRQRRFHDLRGSSATILGELGIAEDVRMARLGHNTRAMARHYAKASEAQDRRAAGELGLALRKGVG